ncbi:MAG TPA: molecular chaperone DnaK [Dehalococcoidia bacterium]|nr:molecular chaperone DnaK [Dehalococcoidia bacterium]HAS27856.1 molecular chaperone DnaK [Dehalococcoidia bacterium]
MKLHLEDDRKRLEEQLEQLKASRPTENRREGSPFGKREEEATETADLENRMALEHRTREQLAEVERALDKFDKGTYGTCEICGKPINPERLEALPQALYCMECNANKAKNG